MTGISLHRLTTVSLIIHLALLGSSLIVFKHTRRFVLPKPYTVNLVSPDILKEPLLNNDSAKSKQETKSTKESKNETTEVIKSKKDSKESSKYVSDRIAAIEAKKKIEKRVKIRNIISLNAREVSKETAKKAAPPQNKTAALSNKGQSSEDYYSGVTNVIWSHWIFPVTEKINLETIVLIRIFTNGSVKIIAYEKKSGNALFDRSIIKAITSADPLPPPPYEMEIGIRFYL